MQEKAGERPQSAVAHEEKGLVGSGQSGVNRMGGGGGGEVSPETFKQDGQEQPL